MNSIKDNPSAYIKKHTLYIDRRIAEISCFISSSSNSGGVRSSDIINSLINEGNSHNLELCDNHINNSLNELYSLLANWNILESGDLLGYIYQGIESRIHKKKLGQFFTPQDIVNHLTLKTVLHKDIGELESFKVLDPACGSGQFLISMYNTLLQKYMMEGYNKDRAAQIIIENNIHGIDIDPLSVKIAQYNLSRISGCSPEKINLHCANFLFKDDIGYIQKIFNYKNFSLIIGNPPWGSSLKSSEKRHYRKNYISASSGINTFTLFIERSQEFLEEKGTLSFLIPEAYLNIKAHQCSRQFTLDNFAIEEICLWGEKFKDVFAPSITLLAHNTEDREKKQSHIVHVLNSKNMETATLIPQESYRKTPENIFNIHYSRKAVAIIDQIQTQECITLQDKSQFYLGIVTGNNKKYISSNQDAMYPDPILTGKNITPYQISESSNYFKYDPNTLQQVAPQLFYLTPQKIVYRFIGKRLTFALDREGHYSLNNVNGFIPAIGSLNNESLIAILNSQVMQYYYENTFFTVKVLRGNLEKLPIKIMSYDTQQRIKTLVTDLMHDDTPETSLLRENVEDIIFHEYGIQDREAYKIQERIYRASA